MRHTLLVRDNWTLTLDFWSKDRARVTDQKGISLLYNMLEIYQSGLEPKNPRYYTHCISRVPDQNGISRLYSMLEIYRSDLEPSRDWRGVVVLFGFVFFLCFSWGRGGGSRLFIWLGWLGLFGQGEDSSNVCLG